MTTSNNNNDGDPRLTSSQPATPAWTRAIGMTEEEARNFEGFTLPPLPQRTSRVNRNNNPPTNTSSTTPTDQNTSTSSNTTTTTNNNNNSTTNTNNPPIVNPNPADNRVNNNMDTNTTPPTTNYNSILLNITSYKNDLLTKLLCPQGRAAPTTSNNTTAPQLVATSSNSPVDVVNRE